VCGALTLGVYIPGCSEPSCWFAAQQQHCLSRILPVSRLSYRRREAAAHATLWVINFLSQPNSSPNCPACLAEARSPYRWLSPAARIDGGEAQMIDRLPQSAHQRSLHYPNHSNREIRGVTRLHCLSTKMKTTTIQRPLSVHLGKKRQEMLQHTHCLAQRIIHVSNHQQRPYRPGLKSIEYLRPTLDLVYGAMNMRSTKEQ
jgi:hypothetical protein